MIKFETNANPEGMAYLKIDGTPNEICKETSAMIKGVFDSLNEQRDSLGVIFLSNIVENIKYIVNDYESKRFPKFLKEFLDSIGNEKESKDIRKSDFDSEEQFSKWLHGDNEEDKNA